MNKVINNPQRGSILVAEPFLGDPNFDRSVILLTEHNDHEGSVGFVINKSLELKLDDIVIGFPSLDTIVYHGGPVQQDNLYFIHNRGELIPGSQPISDNLFWGGELEPLKELIKCKLITTDNIRFFLGYSGWGLGQLQSEIREKSWVVLEEHSLDVFRDHPSSMWKKALNGLGGNYPLWSNSPADPTLN